MSLLSLEGYSYGACPNDLREQLQLFKKHMGILSAKREQFVKERGITETDCFYITEVINMDSCMRALQAKIDEVAELVLLSPVKRKSFEWPKCMGRNRLTKAGMSAYHSDSGKWHNPSLLQSVQPSSPKPIPKLASQLVSQSTPTPQSVPTLKRTQSGIIQPIPSEPVHYHNWYANAAATSTLSRALLSASSLSTSSRREQTDATDHGDLRVTGNEPQLLLNAMQGWSTGGAL